MKNGVLPKRLIYECQFDSRIDFGEGGFYDMESAILYLESALEKEALFQNWCPDWTYELKPSEELGTYDVKVYGEIETNE